MAPSPTDEVKKESAKTVEKLLKEWESLNEAFDKLEKEQAEYIEKMNAVNKIQQQCSKDVKDHKKQILIMKESLRKINQDELSPDVAMQFHDLVADMAERKNRLEDMNESLPRDNNGLYLNVILGHINVSLMNKKDKFGYKDEYEKFKITVTVICMIVSLACAILHFRVVDAVLHFLLVWYYCTLTIRESILRANGSRIKGWWVAHHYLSAILCGVLLTWPDGVCYQSFRTQFILFSLYLSFVQLIQCQYQRGCLYRLRSLGKRHSMDITIEGFHSWMFRGLSFVLPFLFVGYAFQLYNAYVLFNYWRLAICPMQWQILAISILFLLLALGNTMTTGQVCWRKLHEQEKLGHRQRLQTKYFVDDAQEGKEKDQ